MSFDDEKTYPPTKQKLKRERKKGNIWVSTEFASSIFLGCACLFLIFIFSFISFEKIFQSIFLNLNELTVKGALKNAFSPILKQTILFLCLVFVCAIFGVVIQRGWIWKWKIHSGGFFKKRKKRWIFPLLKTAVSLIIAYAVLRVCKMTFASLFSSPSEKMRFIFQKMFILSGFLILAYFVLGIFDLIYQRWAYLKKMRMSKKEMEDEKREEETSKEVNSKRKGSF